MAKEALVVLAIPNTVLLGKTPPLNLNTSRAKMPVIKLRRGH
jgi:hypothetical protein